jgi:catechol-2,3-dioxygenase
MSKASPSDAANDPLLGHPESRLPTAADVEAYPQPGTRIDARADIGHVNLTVTDLERSLAFYGDVLGLSVTQRDERSAFLAAGDYHHHVALNTWDDEATAPPAHSTACTTSRCGCPTPQRSRPSWSGSFAAGTSSAARPTTA